MDEEKLHSELSNRIRQVFDNYEDTGAGESWLILREKLQVKKQERSMAWLWYAAAIILLCAGIWLMPDRKEHPNNAIALRKPIIHTNGLSVASVDTAITSRQGKGSKNVNVHPYISHIFTQNNVAKKPGENSKKMDYSLPNNTITEADTNLHSAHVFTQNNVAKKPGENSKTMDYSLPNNTISEADTNLHSAHVFTQNNVTKKQADSINHTSLLYNPNQLSLVKPTPDVFNQKVPVRNKIYEPEQIKRSITFSVYAATYVNYAKGSDNSINLGAGFTSDVRITGKLKLSTGLAIAQNRLNYSNDNLPNPTQHAATFASLAAAAVESSGKPLIGDGTVQSMVRYTNTLNGNKNYHASMVGLDIPVNLKYELNPRKTDTYIAAGISSGTFINETYRSVYTYSDVSKESDTHNSFSGFDLAKTLNVSFGVGYPLGKNKLIVEPFFKYPLDGLGAQQIKFGSSGVNLKLNFGAVKK